MESRQLRDRDDELRRGLPGYAIEYCDGGFIGGRW